MVLCGVCIFPFRGIQYSVSGWLTIDIIILLFFATLIVTTSSLLCENVVVILSLF